MKDPIAIFDSGLGGLTVVAELRRQLPKECFVYFGDTARVPYGCKSSQTVKRFAIQAVEFLLQFDPKIIVAACNTASSMALETLQEAVDIPVQAVGGLTIEQAIESVRLGASSLVIGAPLAIQAERLAIGEEFESILREVVQRVRELGK